MISFKTVPLNLEIRKVHYKRGSIIHFDEIFRNGSDKPPEYRLWPKHYCAVHKPKCFEWFTQKQIDAMQPHWITQQEELLL